MPSLIPAYVTAIVVVLMMIPRPLAPFPLATFAFVPFPSLMLVLPGLMPGVVVVMRPNLACFVMSKIFVVVPRGRATR